MKLTVGHKVKLKYIPDDLRYSVGLENIGEIVEIDDSAKFYPIAVKWFDNEPPMTHKPDELVIVK